MEQEERERKLVSYAVQLKRTVTRYVGMKNELNTAIDKLVNSAARDGLSLEDISSKLMLTIPENDKLGEYELNRTLLDRLTD